MRDALRPEPDRRVHPTVDVLGRYSWRLIAIGIVGLALLWLLRQLTVVVAPVIVALFVARPLAPVAAWLRRRRWPAGLAALAALLLFFATLAGIAAAVVSAMSGELGSVEETATDALDDIEDWLVEDSPFDVSRATVDRFRERASDQLDDLFRSSGGDVVDNATLAAEVIAGTILAVIVTFFMLRDGDRFVSWSLRLVPQRRREAVERAGQGAWWALGGYLRGAALLGLVEAVAIGVTLLAVGADLVVPMMLITFVAAFVPLVGAVAAGLLAVLVALVTAGTGAALIVGAVALVVQQLDNDLLAPVIYGRALHLHPIVVLLSIVTGGALFGFVGTFLAVPLVAMSVSAAREYRAHQRSFAPTPPEVEVVRTPP